MAGIVLRGEVRTYLDCRETMKVGAECCDPPRKKAQWGDALKLAATCLGIRAAPGQESLQQKVMHLRWGCRSIKAKPGRLLAPHSARCTGEVCGHPSPGCPPRDVGSSRYDEYGAG